MSNPLSNSHSKSRKISFIRHSPSLNSITSPNKGGQSIRRPFQSAANVLGSAEVDSEGEADDETVAEVTDSVSRKILFHSTPNKTDTNLLQATPIATRGNGTPATLSPALNDHEFSQLPHRSKSAISLRRNHASAQSITTSQVKRIYEDRIKEEAQANNNMNVSPAEVNNLLLSRGSTHFIKSIEDQIQVKRPSSEIRRRGITPFDWRIELSTAHFRDAVRHDITYRGGGHVLEAGTLAYSLYRLRQHWAWKLFFCFVITFHCLVIIFEPVSRSLPLDCGSGFTTDHFTALQWCQLLYGVEFGFVFFYLIDLVLALVVHRLEFFFKPANERNVERRLSQYTQQLCEQQHGKPPPLQADLKLQRSPTNKKKTCLGRVKHTCVPFPLDFMNVFHCILVLVQLTEVVTLWATSFSFVLIIRSLRPLMYLFYWRGLQIRVRTMIKTVPSLFNLAACTVVVLVLYALIGVQLFMNMEGYDQGQAPFGVFPMSDFASALVNLFTLVTRESYPDVMYPAFRANNWYSIYFISFLLVCSNILLALMLAVAFDAFRNQMKLELVRDRLRKRVSLLRCFLLLQRAEELVGKLPRDPKSACDLISPTVRFTSSTNIISTVSPVKPNCESFPSPVSVDAANTTTTTTTTTTISASTNHRHITNSRSGSRKEMAVEGGHLHNVRVSEQLQQQQQQQQQSRISKQHTFSEELEEGLNKVNVLAMSDDTEESSAVIGYFTFKKFYQALVESKILHLVIPSSELWRLLTTQEEDELQNRKLGRSDFLEILELYDIFLAEHQAQTPMDVYNQAGSIRQSFILMLNSTYFNIFLAIMIIGSVVNLAFISRQNLDGHFLFDIFNYCFMGIFGSEILLKIIVFTPRGFFYNNWNRFDMLIVIASLTATVLTLFLPPALAVLPRIIISFRVLRLISLFTRFQLIISTTLQIVPALFRFLFIGLMVMYFYAVVGMQLFSTGLDTIPNNPNPEATFASFGRAMLSLYQVTITSNWHWVLYAGVRAGWSGYVSWYFISFYLIFSIVIHNLFTAIMIVMFQLQSARIVHNERRSSAAIHEYEIVKSDVDAAFQSQQPAQKRNSDTEAGTPSNGTGAPNYALPVVGGGLASLGGTLSNSMKRRLQFQSVSSYAHTAGATSSSICPPNEGDPDYFTPCEEE